MILTNAFVVNCVILGHSAEVISAKAAKQNVSAVLSCKTRCQFYFILAVLTPYFLVGDPGPDCLTFQLTPNTSREASFLMQGIIKVKCS